MALCKERQLGEKIKEKTKEGNNERKQETSKKKNVILLVDLLKL